MPQVSEYADMADMVEVTHEEFFARVGPLDVHPRNHETQRTHWETPERVVRGISFPGWKNPGDPKAYYLPKGVVDRMRTTARS